VQRRVDANHPVFLLDCAKDKIFSRPLLSPPPPHYLVIAQATAKVALVQVVENAAQIKVSSLMAQIQMPLHGKGRMSDLSFGLLFFPWRFHRGGEVVAVRRLV